MNLKKLSKDVCDKYSLPNCLIKWMFTEMSRLRCRQSYRLAFWHRIYETIILGTRLIFMPRSQLSDTTRWSGENWFVNDGAVCLPWKKQLEFVIVLVHLIRQRKNTVLGLWDCRHIHLFSFSEMVVTANLSLLHAPVVSSTSVLLWTQTAQTGS